MSITGRNNFLCSVRPFKSIEILILCMEKRVYTNVPDLC